MNVKEAFEAIRPAAKQAQATLKLADLLESLVGVENHGDELVIRLEKLKADVAAAEAAVTKAQAEAVKVCAEARAKADEIIADAIEQADSFRDNAAADAEKVLAAAGASRAQEAAVEAELAASSEKLRAEVAALEQRRTELSHDIGSLREKAAIFAA